jgi:hypothetical protein
MPQFPQDGGRAEDFNRQDGEHKQRTNRHSALSTDVAKVQARAPRTRHHTEQISCTWPPQLPTLLMTRRCLKKPLHRTLHRSRQSSRSNAADGAATSAPCRTKCNDTAQYRTWPILEIGETATNQAPADMVRSSALINPGNTFFVPRGANCCLQHSVSQISLRA